MAKIYSKKVDSCIGLGGRGDGGCPHGFWADVNCTKFYCKKYRKELDFKNKPDGISSDHYIPPWCKLPDA